MAQIGDQYSYEVIYTDANTAPQFIDKAGRVRDSLGRFVATGRQVADALEDIPPAANAAGASLATMATAADASAANGGRLTAALGRIGPAMLQIGQLAEDAQFGVRGLANNVPILISALGGFSPQAQLAAGASSLLLIAFRDQIEAGLEWAGVLDENVVKGLHKGEEATLRWTEKLAKLREEFEDAGKPAKDQAGAITQAFEDAGKAAEAEVARMIGALGDPEIDRKREELEEKLGRLAEGIRREQENPDIASFGVLRQLKAALADTDKALKELEGEGVKALEKLKREAVQSDEALARLAGAARAAGEAGLADALRDATDAAKKLKEANEATAKQAEEDARKAEAEEAKRKQRHEAELERKQREAEAAEEKAEREAEAEEEAQDRMLRAIDNARKQQERLELDEATQRVLGALGGRFDQGISAALQSRTLAGQELGAVGVSGATDDVAGQVVRRLVRSGVGLDAARGAARQLVEEQAGAIQAVIDSNNLTHNLLVEALNGQGQLARIQQQHRERQLRLQRQAEQNRRAMAPLNFMQGNPLGGWF